MKNEKTQKTCSRVNKLLHEYSGFRKERDILNKKVRDKLENLPVEDIIKILQEDYHEINKDVIYHVKDVIEKVYDGFSIYFINKIDEILKKPWSKYWGHENYLEKKEDITKQTKLDIIQSELLRVCGDSYTFERNSYYKENLAYYFSRTPDEDSFKNYGVGPDGEHIGSYFSKDDCEKFYSDYGNHVLSNLLRNIARLSKDLKEVEKNFEDYSSVAKRKYEANAKFSALTKLTKSAYEELKTFVESISIKSSKGENLRNEYREKHSKLIEALNLFTAVHFGPLIPEDIKIISDIEKTLKPNETDSLMLKGLDVIKVGLFLKEKYSQEGYDKCQKEWKEKMKKVGERHEKEVHDAQVWAAEVAYDRRYK